VHKHSSQVAVVVHDGNLQDETRLEKEDLAALGQEYAGGEAAIEASGTYRPIYEMLDGYLDVTLANPAKTRIIADAAVKTDRVDAKRLAHMLRVDVLAESYVPPGEIRELRDLVRTPKSLIEERTAEKNCVRAVLARINNTYDSELFGPTGREFLAELSPSNADRTIVEAQTAYHVSTSFICQCKCAHGPIRCCE
jgi:transposase